MDNDFLKEKIKLLTEWLRGLYGLFILVSSGAATVYVKIIFLTYNMDYKIILLKYYIIIYTIFSAIVFDVFIFILILIINRKIGWFIRKLKQS